MTVAAPAIPLALTVNIAHATAPRTHRRAAKAPNKFMMIFGPVLLCLAPAELLSNFFMTYFRFVVLAFSDPHREKPVLPFTDVLRET
jgi:hypothetical protein